MRAYLPAILHAIMAFALLTAYVVLTVTGNGIHADVLGGALAGQLGGIGVTGIANGIAHAHATGKASK